MPWCQDTKVVFVDTLFLTSARSGVPLLNTHEHSAGVCLGTGDKVPATMEVRGIRHTAREGEVRSACLASCAGAMEGQ